MIVQIILSNTTGQALSFKALFHDIILASRSIRAIYIESSNIIKALVQGKSGPSFKIFIYTYDITLNKLT